MVYGIVQNARGYVNVQSGEGKGTVFDLLFRVASGEERELTLGQLKPGLEGDETILLVDDEPMVRELGIEILRSYGYRIINAADGVEALEIYHSRRREIDLVILDLLMPKMSGKETFKRLRQMDSEVPILICSGYGTREDDSNPLISNDVPLVHKPFQPEGLVHAVRQVLDQRKQTGGDVGEKRGATGKVIAFQR